MRKTTRSVLCVLACLALSPLGFSQEGHPLTGAWTGQWGPEQSHISLVMEWDGEDIGGFLLLGLDSIPIESVTLNVTDWTLRLEANGEDSSGNAIEVVAEGRLDDIGSAHRTITGTWRQNAVEGDFRITRD